MFIVGVFGLCLAVFAAFGLCSMVFWVLCPKPQRSPPPNNCARAALGALHAFARRREDDRFAAQVAFNRRNADFQRELAERLEEVRRNRDIVTPKNTPLPSREPTPRLHSRQATPAPFSRAGTPLPPPISRAATPVPPTFSRAHTPVPPPISRHGSPAPPSPSRPVAPPFSRPGTPIPQSRAVSVGPPSPSPNPPPEHIYDSPASSLYESIDKSPQVPDAPLPPSPQTTPPRYSLFGRLLRKTVFYPNTK